MPSFPSMKQNTPSPALGNDTLLGRTSRAKLVLGRGSEPWGAEAVVNNLNSVLLDDL